MEQGNATHLKKKYQREKQCTFADNEYKGQFLCIQNIFIQRD